MTREEQLQWEDDKRLPAGAAALASALLVFGGSLFFQLSIREADDAADLLRLIDEKPAQAIAGGAIQALGLLALIVPLVYLYRATRFRREQVPKVALVLAVLGPAGFAAIAVLRQFALLDVADDFLAGTPIEGSAGEDRAENLIEDSSVAAVGGVGLGLGLALGFAVVLISLNAMRAGLTSRFMGIIGIIVGALYVLPVAGGPQIVQLFWLAALGMLILGRWPGGRGPAWEAGEAMPWPTAADQRAMVEAMKDAVDQPAQDTDGDEPDEAPRPASRKRKRRGGRQRGRR